MGPGNVCRVCVHPGLGSQSCRCTGVLQTAGVLIDALLSQKSTLTHIYLLFWKWGCRAYYSFPAVPSILKTIRQHVPKGLRSCMKSVSTVMWDYLQRKRSGWDLSRVLQIQCHMISDKLIRQRWRWYQYGSTAGIGLAWDQPFHEIVFNRPSVLGTASLYVQNHRSHRFRRLPSVLPPLLLPLRTAQGVRWGRMPWRPQEIRRTCWQQWPCEVPSNRHGILWSTDTSFHNWHSLDSLVHVSRLTNGNRTNIDPTNGPLTNPTPQNSSAIVP